MCASAFALLRAALTRSSRPGTLDEAQLADYRAAWAEPGALRAMLDWYRAMALARPCAEKIVVPVPIIQGDADSALEPGLADAALRYFDDGHIARLPHATHWLHHEESDQVSALLLEFLGGG